MMEPTRAEMVAFESLAHSKEWIAPQYRDKVALTFVVTRDEARRFRIGSEWILAEAEA